jgi:hypothetical protein
MRGDYDLCIAPLLETLLRHEDVTPSQDSDDCLMGFLFAEWPTQTYHSLHVNFDGPQVAWIGSGVAM